MLDQKTRKPSVIETLQSTEESAASENSGANNIAGQSVRLTEDNYRTIFENAAAAITVTDRNENLIIWNHLAAELLGMKPEEMYLKPIKEVYPEEEWKRIRSEHIRKKGINHHMDTKILNHAGKIIDVDLSVSVLKGIDGSVQGSIGIMRDISERKSVESSLKESIELSRGMIETAATAIFLIKDGRFTFVNRIFEEMTGYSAQELKAMNRLDLIFPEDAEKAQANARNLSGGKSTDPLILRVLRKDFETIWVSEKMTSIIQADKEHIMGNWMDITEWKIAESIATEHSNQTEILLEIGNTVGRTLKLQEIAESVLDILNSKLHNGPIAFFSLPSQSETFTLLVQKGFSQDFIKRMTAVIFGKGLIGRTVSTGKSVIISINSDNPRFDPGLLRIDGLSAICCVPIFARDKINGVICMGSRSQHYSLDRQARLLELVANQIGVAIDNARLYERTSDFAFIDGLTGLYNRRFFEEGLNREMSRSLRNGRSFSILSLDLDNLKKVNDTFGHQAGDKMLKEFSVILYKLTRKADITARVGGDEFMILAAETDHDAASNLAKRIWSKVNSTRVEMEGAAINLSVSGGIVSYPLHGNAIEVLTKKADEAMYKAKQAGKNRIFMAVP